jgi:hypothetical protein
MTGKPFRNKPINRLLALVLFTSSGVVFSVVTQGGGITHQSSRKLSGEVDQIPRTQIDTKFDPIKYLPPGASVSNPEKTVLFADIDADGKQEVIIFYTMLNEGRPQARILVLKPTAAGYQRVWENIDLGSGFADPSGVYDLNKSGRPQIVAYRIVGASCPGVLDIFQATSGAIEKITGDWIDTCQSDLEIKDLDGDGIDEIIFRPLKYGVNRRIYSWNGKEYARTDEQHAYYFNDELQQLVGWIYEHRPLPTPARTTLCEQAVQIYLLQRRCTEAIQLCKAVLPMIDNPELTQPRSVPRSSEERNQVVAHFEVDRMRDKAKIYRLLADAFKASGDLESARKYNGKSRVLESAAAEKNSRLQ